MGLSEQPSPGQEFPPQPCGSPGPRGWTQSEPHLATLYTGITTESVTQSWPGSGSADQQRSGSCPAGPHQRFQELIYA